MAKLVHFILMVLAVSLAGPALAQSGPAKRIVLLIGNDRYSSFQASYPNIKNDIALLDASFKARGFEVEQLRNATTAQMLARLESFKAKATQADAAIVYYAGTGVEVQGVNFLVGVDAPSISPDETLSTADKLAALVKSSLIPINTAVLSVQTARNFSMIIVDSGRFDPFVNGKTRGFSLVRSKTADVAANSNTVIFFGSQPGLGSEDGEPGGNSPFAQALAKHMATPGLEIGLFARRVRADVMRMSQSRQRPEMVGELGEREFYFAGQPAGPATTPAPVFSAQPRVALVIGNSDYNQDGDIGDDRSSAPVQQQGYASDLANPANDAADIAAALTRLKFEVSLVENADYATMLAKLFEFEKKVTEAGPDALVVIYYAGHAIQVGGGNYIIPAGAKMPNVDLRRLPAAQAELILSQFALPVQTSLLERLQNPSGRGLNLVILDSCRDDPWQRPGASRSLGRGVGTRGLGEVSTDLTRTAIAFATKSGAVAADGEGRNSPYAAALKQIIEQPGITVIELLDQVGAKVQLDTNGQQIPYTNGPSIGRTCLGSCLTAQ